MSGNSGKNFNLPWHQRDHYWLSFYPKSGAFGAGVADILQRLGCVAIQDGFALRTGRQWKTSWDSLCTALSAVGGLSGLEAGISFGDAAPASRQEANCKEPASVQALADSLWLGDALIEDRLVCYLQPVHSSKDRVFGYESFARVQTADGGVIGGLQIVAASIVLGIEYMIDRHLHVQAIKTFAGSAFNGFLFVNFFPGFIHRPAVYLEGLSETAKQYGIVAKHIVLDFTNSEKPRDIAHIRSVCDYSRSRGYSVALDDVASVEMVQKLVSDIRPDFVKIDMHLVREVLSPVARETVRTIVELVHGAGGMVIGEGVESDDIFQALKSLGVDLFQGYLFGAPMPVEAALKLSGTA
jgi:EAL domain-containing protein (putative c-di-GMP-specific phosphodiesterase class I)